VPIFGPFPRGCAVTRRRTMPTLTHFRPPFIGSTTGRSCRKTLRPPCRYKSRW
jgi:hypothetical protein